MNAQSAAASAARTQPAHVGDHLREWRQRRHLSQLDLAGDAEISARHLSFVETGRAAPSRDMVLRLAERLEVPLRERNVLLVAAGFAPAFPQRSLDDPALKSARAAIDLVLKAHEPNPALAVDRHWNLVSANRMVTPLLRGHFAGHAGAAAQRAAAQFSSAGHCAAHRQSRRMVRPPAGALAAPVRGYRRSRIDKTLSRTENLSDPGALGAAIAPDTVAIPFKMRFGDEILSFMSTTMIFGTPVDVTLSELALETFFPADDLTAARMRAMAAGLK